MSCKSLLSLCLLTFACVHLCEGNGWVRTFFGTFKDVFPGVDISDISQCTVGRVVTGTSSHTMKLKTKSALSCAKLCYKKKLQPGRPKAEPNIAGLNWNKVTRSCSCVITTGELTIIGAYIPVATSCVFKAEDPVTTTTEPTTTTTTTEATATTTTTPGTTTTQQEKETWCSDEDWVQALNFENGGDFVMGGSGIKSREECEQNCIEMQQNGNPAIIDVVAYGVEGRGAEYCLCMWETGNFIGEWEDVTTAQDLRDNTKLYLCKKPDY